MGYRPVHILSATNEIARQFADTTRALTAMKFNFLTERIRRKDARQRFEEELGFKKSQLEEQKVRDKNLKDYYTVTGQAATTGADTRKRVADQNIRMKNQSISKFSKGLLSGGFTGAGTFAGANPDLSYGEASFLLPSLIGSDASQRVAGIRSRASGRATKATVAKDQWTASLRAVADGYDQRTKELQSKLAAIKNNLAPNENGIGRYWDPGTSSFIPIIYKESDGQYTLDKKALAKKKNKNRRDAYAYNSAMNDIARLRKTINRRSMPEAKALEINKITKRMMPDIINNTNAFLSGLGSGEQQSYYNKTDSQQVPQQAFPSTNPTQAVQGQGEAGYSPSYLRDLKDPMFNTQ